MRCHFSDKDATICDPSGLNIWTANVHNPSVLESVENLTGTEAKPCSDTLSTLYSLDSVSQTYKRKILECEKEDFEDRFSKIQRKRQMLRASAKANLVIDDDDDDDEDDDLDEQEIYEQMEWIEDEKNSMTLHLWKDKDVDLSIQSINSGNPIMYIPKFNWREERRHLLRISMAKIRGVDDPETYLRRSVLINNTVKRLQKDVAISYRYPPLASASVLHENVTSYLESNWDSGNSNEEVICKNNYSDGSSFQCSRFIGNADYTTTIYNYPDVQTGTPYNFHLSLITPFSPEKSTDSLQNEISQNSIFSKSLQEDQSICDPSLSCRTLKQTHPVHVYSSQPCGLQYRNASHDDANCEYPESNTSSSILDSVVYHSLIASLET